MRQFVALCIAVSTLVAWSSPAISGGDDDGRALVMKAIAAAGGETKLAKLESAIMKEKGTYYGLGEGQPFTSNYWMKFPGQFKMEIIDVFTMCLDGDKGWIKDQQGVKDMSKENLEVEQWNFKAGWICHLTPLKDKAYTVKADGTAKVGEQATNVVKVSRKNYPTVKLYFDTKTNLLVKSEFKTKSGEQKFKEVLREVYYSEHKKVEGVTFPHKIELKNDGKIYVEAEVTEMKAAKLDAKTFAKPASD